MGQIAPFSEKQVEDGVISATACLLCMDMTCGFRDESKISTTVTAQRLLIHWKAFDERSFVSVQAPSGDRAAQLVCGWRGGRLSTSGDTAGRADDLRWGSRTNMRGAGLSVNVTPFEPEWRGFVTLEISNRLTPPLSGDSMQTKGYARFCSSSPTRCAR